MQVPAQRRAVPVGQPHVEEDDVRPDRGHPGQGLGARSRLAGDRDTRVVLEDLGDAPADDLVVVDQEGAHHRGNKVHPPASSRHSGARQSGH